MLSPDRPSRKKLTVIEWCIVAAVLAIAAAIVVPAFVGHQNVRHDPKEGWTYVAQTRFGDDIFMKHFPEQHITIYTTWRGMSVVKD
jgi:hypothetical protein